MPINDPPQWGPNTPPGQYPGTYEQSYGVPSQQQPAGWQLNPPQPPPVKKGMSTGAKVTLIIAGVLLLLCGGGFVACTAFVGGAGNEFTKNQEAKVSHVKLTGCNIQRAAAGFLPNVKVDLAVNNTSKNQETYFIDVFVFNSANERVGNSTAIVSDVRPGQTAKETEMVLLTKAVSGNITCKVDKVS